MYSSSPLPDLLRACVETRDAAAWQEFIKRFHRLIAGVVLRTCRQYGSAPVELVDDLVQDTYLKLCADRCRLLQEFESRHPEAIYGFLKVVAANVTRDHFKASHSKKRGGAALTESADEDSLRRGAAHSIPVGENLERILLIQKVDDCLRAIASGPTSERDRRIFWLHYRAGLPASAIATLPTIQLTTKGVESTLLRLVRQVRQRLVYARSQGPPAGISGEGIPPAESF